MSEDIHKWTDGKYALMFDEHTFFVFDNEEGKRMTALQVTKKLNEQQAIIDKLKSDIEETEISIKLFEDDIATKDKKIEEQQVIIQELERKLKKYEKIGEEQLKQIIELQDEINDCEKFRYTVFKRIGELVE